MPDPIDYEMLAEAELANAATASTPVLRRAHLDQASIFATMAERHRHATPATDAPAPEKRPWNPALSDRRS
ncbi:hypothetical protein ASE75_01480 [Sphingomonas sp. Leaf17]|uniref:hypothetical protein n=1 Tax=Sphingomonas sp. Leaf17 TaxID=1735683 RepID=UPI0006FC7E00|nr:hypothetical protein [Sphingomonas sp. Leaf17]KQM67632.1 hypothetical protein ASE75_01480 [Sphingomonas sp. Leaf17]